MNNEPVKAFTRKIMDINASYTGMDGASSGITGSAGMGDQVIHPLRRAVIEFASEYREIKPDIEVLTELSDQIEGRLQTLRAISDITQAKFEELINDLQNLIDSQQGTQA